MPELSQHNCPERDRLERRYRRAISLWIELGGTDSSRKHSPKVVAAKQELDRVTKLLLKHRGSHGC
jgi:hypothetical protein